MTRRQLSGCAIDSQVLNVIVWCRFGRVRLAKRYSFDIIRATEFAAPEDFISLKPKARKLAKKRPGKKPGQKP
ncbi:hypothetical protein [Pseudomonas sp. B11(2017)]|uniref:hypothetical protein n=1 Tax=Pseudomonas sp. B11(2017) TaxID=1981748 RepID=UPI00111BFF26|nr:hypothetical protein [Pseudomonas sp. B11(2017)]